MNAPLQLRHLSRLALLATLACACGEDSTTGGTGDFTADLATHDAGEETGLDVAEDVAPELDTEPDGAPDLGDTEDVEDVSDTIDDLAGVGDTLDTPDGPEPCNGHVALCDRRFDEVTFATTHNAMSNADEGWLGPNQQHGITRQLEDGVRAMMLDTHKWRDELYLCHSVCEFGSKLLVDGLREISDFLAANPREVFTLIFQDGISPAETEAAFVASGLVDFVYTPSGDPWPTLGAMIESNQRLVVTAEFSAGPPDWYLHAWDVMFDTPYSFGSAEEFSCDLNRGRADNDLFLINHWITVLLPSEAGAREVNVFDVLHDRAVQCAEERGRHPNFIAVDFYAHGDLFEVVDALNFPDR